MILLIQMLIVILVTGSSFTLMKASWFCLVEPILKRERTTPAFTGAVLQVL